MKKQLLSLGAICLALVFSGQVMAQAEKTVQVAYATTTPTIDGTADEWDGVPAQAIDVPFLEETVSMANGDATWQAVWDDANFYIVVTVPDDNFYPYTEANVNSWQADKVELYFDVNATKIDGKGPSTADGNGHFQFAPGIDETPEDYEFAFSSLDDATWICEYKIPFSILLDEDGFALDPYVLATIGFDVTVIDLDETGLGVNETMGRINYNNDASLAESWASLDYSADLTFVQTIGVSENVSNNVSIVSSNFVNDYVKLSVATTNVKIMNSVGQVVKNENGNVNEVNVADLAKGVYIVAVTTAQGEYIANKIVKQ
jgi:hypothetical protein